MVPSLITDTTLCWLTPHAKSAGQGDRDVVDHKRVCVSAVLPMALPFPAEEPQQEVPWETSLWSVQGSSAVPA